MPPPRPPSSASRASLLLVFGVLAAVLAFGAWAVPAAWRLGGASPMGVHGYVALALAVVVTAILGGGLMWLAFHSARRGYDDIEED